MRVLLDATSIPPDRGGVGRYVDALLPALTDLGLQLVVVCQAADAHRMARLAPSAEVIPAPAGLAVRPVRLAWEQTALPSLARRTGASVLHSPHYTMPRLTPVPTVVTLHDATFFSHPELHSVVKARFFRAATRRAVLRGAALVVPSEATAREVQRFVGGRPETFYVAHHGVDTDVFHPVEAEALTRFRAALGVGEKRYVAFLGTLEPRKNVPALVRGWQSAVRGLAEPPALVLAGGPGWDSGVTPAIDAVEPGLQVLSPGYLPLEDLAPLLAGADVVAYPSLGEGFGLPVLEAMACGATVLTTRALSLPEVGGDAVAYCGTDEGSIAQGLTRLLGDPHHRHDLARRALERSRLFTWKAAATAHLRAYESAVRQSRGA